VDHSPIGGADALPGRRAGGAPSACWSLFAAHGLAARRLARVVVYEQLYRGAHHPARRAVPIAAPELSDADRRALLAPCPGRPIEARLCGRSAPAAAATFRGRRATRRVSLTLQCGGELRRLASGRVGRRPSPWPSSCPRWGARRGARGSRASSPCARRRVAALRVELLGADPPARCRWCRRTPAAIVIGRDGADRAPRGAPPGAAACRRWPASGGGTRRRSWKRPAARPGLGATAVGAMAQTEVLTFSGGGVRRMRRHQTVIPTHRRHAARPAARSPAPGTPAPPRGRCAPPAILPGAPAASASPPGPALVVTTGQQTGGS